MVSYSVFVLYILSMMDVFRELWPLLVPCESGEIGEGVRV